MGETELSTYPRRRRSWGLLREVSMTVAVIAAVLMIGLLINHVGGDLPPEQRFFR